MNIIADGSIEIITKGSFLDQGYKVDVAVIRVKGKLMNEWLKCNRQPDCLEYVDNPDGLQQALESGQKIWRPGSIRCRSLWASPVSRMCLIRMALALVYGIIQARFSRWYI